MTNLAQGVVGKATKYTGIVQKIYSIAIVDGDHNPMPNLKFLVAFEGGQNIEVQSNSQGVLIIPMRTKGKIQLRLIEDAHS